MAEQFDLVVRGGTVVTPNGRERTDVGIRAGRFAALGDLSLADAESVFDATGLHVLPGVIDSQVHFREPGLEHKEDLASGTAGAAMGGVTAVFEMPNTKPSTTTPAALKDKLDRADGRVWTDVAFFLGAAAENATDLGGWETLPGCAGVKVFMGSSTGSLLVEEDDLLRQVLTYGRRRVAIHSEDEPRLRERFALVKDGADPAMHAVWRDEETAIRSTTRLLKIVRETGRPVHVLHITTAEELELLAANRDLATVEVLPQHLTLAAPECYERLGTYAQMNPPIREARHREALWAAIRAGLVDVIGSDHAPHTAEEKAKPYPQSPSGLTGVQTLVPLMLDHVNAGRLTLERFVDLTSAGPCRVYGVAGKGRIARGYDADLTLVDLNTKRTIENKWILSKTGWTPYDGMSVTGWPKATITRGHVVMQEDELLGDPIGLPIPFVGQQP